MAAKLCKYSERLRGTPGDLVKRIDAHRMALGIPATDFARKAGYSYTIWSQICNGHNRNPSITTLSNFAEAVGLRITLAKVPQ